MSSYAVHCTDQQTDARCGTLQTLHGAIETPAFMPVGTQAAVKAVSPDELIADDYRVILGNTYHLNDRPGAELIHQLGGLHRFMNWPRAILTDSGGFQVFSLAALRSLSDEGVSFKSHSDGRTLFLGPKESMDIQRLLASDIAMVFDECPPYPCERKDAEEAVRRTLLWAARCAEQPRADGQLVFGIVQGSVFEDLREYCATELKAFNFDGYAVGGVSVGEPDTLIRQGVEHSVKHLPVDKPRYLMGVGYLPQVLESIAQGIDMFDCVMPTRFARNGTAFTRAGRFPVKSAVYKEDPNPIDDTCECPACRGFSRAYIRHLLNVDEILGVRLLTLHNLHFYAKVLDEAREQIRRGTFGDYLAHFTAHYRPITSEHKSRV